MNWNCCLSYPNYPGTNRATRFAKGVAPYTEGSVNQRGRKEETLS